MISEMLRDRNFALGFKSVYCISRLCSQTREDYKCDLDLFRAELSINQQ